MLFSLYKIGHVAMWPCGFPTCWATTRCEKASSPPGSDQPMTSLASAGRHPSARENSTSRLAPRSQGGHSTKAPPTWALGPPSQSKFKQFFSSSHFL